MSGPIVVAVDGTAASGKGTLAKLLARRFGLAHLDSGKLYRLVALGVFDADGDPDSDTDALEAVKSIHADPMNAAAMDNPRLLGAEIGAAASRVAAKPGVREALLEVQRNFARSPPRGARGACVDGRDIGTVVWPDATAKLFVDAAPEVRAYRRWLELKALHGVENSIPDRLAILREINARDDRDRSRSIAPLRAAPDAALLDTSNLDIDAAFAAALVLVGPRIEKALKACHRG